jgi:hypothetical protein
MQLGEGFRKIFTDGDNSEDIKLPIVGYTGHVKGDRATGAYASNFRTAIIKSKM